MIRLPKWAQIYLDDNSCPECGDALSNSEIISVGIRKASDGKPRLCFDSLCNFCGQRCSTTLVTSFDLEPEQIAMEILAAYQGESMIEIVSGRRALPPGRAHESFAKDCEALKKFLSENDSFEDFMRHCGISDKEIKNP